MLYPQLILTDYMKQEEIVDGIIFYFGLEETGVMKCAHQKVCIPWKGSFKLVFACSTLPH